MSSPKTKTDESLPPGTTLDDFLGGRIVVVQPQAGHRAGSDAVWLQAAVAARPGDRVLDAGAGVGVAGLCLLSRSPQISMTAVDIDERACALARANAARNGLSRQFRAIEADLTAAAENLMANPPFHTEGTVRPARDRGRAAAHIMQDGALNAWIRTLATFTAPKGRLTLIHRPEALRGLLPLLDRRFGAITLFPLFPKDDEPAIRVIVQTRKGSRAALSLLDGLVLHDVEGSYTAKAEAVLRHGAALELSVTKSGSLRA